jgi:hypothetical protein
MREMNLMVFVVATFAAGMAIALTSRSESGSVADLATREAI